MQRAVVSGITGHLGRELARQLAAAGVEVHGLTRQDIALAKRWTEGAHLHRVDGRTETLVELLEAVKPDAVFHLAALTRCEQRVSDLLPLVQANILFGTQLLEATTRSGCGRFLTTSSSLQHVANGEYRAPNLCAATKQAFEDLLLYYADEFDLTAACLTLYTLYSESETHPTLLSDIASALGNQRPVTLSTEDVRIDPVHVEDAADAFLQTAFLMEQKVLRPKILHRYSVTSGGEVTAEHLVNLFERLSNRKLMLTRKSSSPFTPRARPWRGTTVPGWNPRVTLEKGVARMLSRAQARAPAFTETITHLDTPGGIGCDLRPLGDPESLRPRC